MTRTGNKSWTVLNPSFFLFFNVCIFVILNLLSQANCIRIKVVQLKTQQIELEGLKISAENNNPNQTANDNNFDSDQEANFTLSDSEPPVPGGSAASGVIQPPIDLLPLPDTPPKKLESENPQSNITTASENAESENHKSEIQPESEYQNPKTTKGFVYAYTFNVTSNNGKKPTCDCGFRRVGGREISNDPLFLSETYTYSNKQAVHNHNRIVNKNKGKGSEKDKINQRENPSNKIVGGTEALPGEFPWRVGIQTRLDNNATFICGGSIIARNWILTAAHCFQRLNTSEVIYVNAGDHDKSTPTEADNIIIRASLVVIHPNYIRATFDNDLALIQLERDLPFRNNIQPICLPFKLVSRDMSGAMVTTGGWGLSRENGTSSDVLKTADLSFLTTSQCRVVVGSERAATVTNNMVCTLAPNSDTCQGDSGGTLDYYDMDTNRYIAVAIVSNGMGCGRENEAGFNTNLFNYLDFIRSTTGIPLCVK